MSQVNRLTRVQYRALEDYISSLAGEEKIIKSTAVDLVPVVIQHMGFSVSVHQVKYAAEIVQVELKAVTKSTQKTVMAALEKRVVFLEERVKELSKHMPF